ncbi:hypothetical protein JTI58_22425 [Lysinibacillus fusiformis]|uniref:hypothetical protein n=1 Tax=Lysinibacillus fusiformis TaxID=28031 RepID=UPI0019682CFD|nr:hypothetical protein [Lysinibacillus fusiformis]QSB09700.1 hypothetical protein JTI58_22425 [Lysinibacillus fusiformis]
MNHYEKQFLKLGLENFYKSGSSYSEVQPKNSQELIDFTNVAKQLYENEWLIPHSDNIFSNSVSIVPNETLICYELTDKGLSEAKNLQS